MRGSINRKRLLLVEGDAAFAHCVARSFVLHGYSVRIVATLAQAEAASREGPFDCGLFDVALGPDDGFVLAKQLVGEGTVRSAVFFSSAAGTGAGDRDSTGPLAAPSEQLEQLRFMVALACG